MAKLTLLEMVKDILSDMDSDEIDSITDTVEGEQVSQTIKTVYYQLVSTLNLPEHYNLETLTQVGSTSTPTSFTIPEGVADIDWFKYDKIKSGSTRKDWQYVKYLDRQIFVERSHGLDSTATTTVTVNLGSSALPIYVRNDKAPEWYTSFDDAIIICDSYDSAVDTSYLLTNKTMIYAYTPPDWEDHVNDFIPSLDEKYFPMLLAEAKSTCFVNLKQQANGKIDTQYKEQRSFLQNDKFRIKKANAHNSRNYGRC